MLRRNRTEHAIAVGASVFLCGCASEGGPAADIGDSSPEGEALFAVVGTATPDSIYGVWSTRRFGDEELEGSGRVRFSQDTIDNAARCTVVSTGETRFAHVRGRARVSNSEISILESKIDTRVRGDYRCSANIDVSAAPACKGESRTRCFLLEGSRLTLFGVSPSETEELVKIAD